MRRIIYLCPADNVPTGGVKVIYRHAELLTSLGADAFVLHPFDSEFTCNWFSHSASLLRSLALDPNSDFVIIPEIWAPIFGPQCIDQRVRFAIFVQNGYFTYPRLPAHSPELFDRTYQAADLVLSISEDTTRMVALNYPQIDPTRLVRVRYSIHERFFARPNDIPTGAPCITYMPRKMADHANQVVFALRHHLPPSWQIVPIHNVDEARLVAMLFESRIFLSFSSFEGLPAPPVEAALAGNLVIGYTGQGASEYWDAPNFQEIYQGDVHSFVRTVHRAALAIDAQCITHDDLAPGIDRLAKSFSPASEAINLRMLLGRIERCFVVPAFTGDKSQLLAAVQIASGPSYSALGPG